MHKSRDRGPTIRLLIATTLVIVAALASLAARGSHGQAPPQTQVTVGRSVKLVSPAPQASSAFNIAATQNTSLRTELIWTFGGKSQRGWYLYDHLIGETIASHDDTVSVNFATKLSGWQKKRGLNANGILDQVALLALVSHWQSNRLKDRTPARIDQLLIAPTSDFFDPSRASELRQVERNTYSAYKRMIAAAAADPSLRLGHNGKGELSAGEKYLKIVSAFRTREYQENLRRQSPQAGRAGLAVNSPHFTGRALDLYVGGSPVDTKDTNRALQVNTPVYRWLVRNAGRFGFRPYFYEPWHWEYVQ